MKKIKIKKVISVYFYFVALLLLVGCSSNSLAISENYIIESNHDIDMFVLTDVHYLAKELHDQGDAFNKFIYTGDGKQIKYIEEIMEGLLLDVKVKNPDFLIISGDLTINGEVTSHKELSTWLSKIEDLGTTVYVIPGNHDINNPWARGFKGEKQVYEKTVNPEEFAQIYSEFGYGEDLFRDEASLSYLATPSEDLWLMMLDTNIYDNNMTNGYPEAVGDISLDTYDWMEECFALAREKDANIMVVMHHSLLEHLLFFQEDYTVRNNETLLTMLHDNSIEIVLSGHIHIQDIVSDQFMDHKIFDIATESLGLYPHQYGNITYSRKDGNIEYKTSKLSVEAWAKSQELTNKDLIEFNQYSKEYFEGFAYRMAYKNLNKDVSISDEDKVIMSELMMKLNVRLFSGTEGLNDQDLQTSKGLTLWKEAKDSFLKGYIMEILKDNLEDDNHLNVLIKQN